MKLIEKAIKVPHSGKVTIFAFGDLQFGSVGFDQDMWNEFKKEFTETENAYAIGLGDYSDFLRPSKRASIRAAFADDMSAHEELDELAFFFPGELLLNALSERLE